MSNEAIDLYAEFAKDTTAYGDTIDIDDLQNGIDASPAETVLLVLADYLEWQEREIAAGALLGNDTREQATRHARWIEINRKIRTEGAWLWQDPDAS